MSNNFPLHQFRLVLTTTSKIKVSIHPFILEYRRRNYKWIIGSLEELWHCLQGRKTELQLTFNAIFAVKYIVDSGDNLMIALVETYLLPQIYEIAIFDLQGHDDRRGSRYFLGKGFQVERSQLEFFGFNYIRMASELLIVSALIKPKRTYKGEEIEHPSDFQAYFNKLQAKGFKPYLSYAFYKVANIKQSRTAFLENLLTFGRSKTEFEQHYLSLLRQYLIRQKTAENVIDMNKMLEKGQMPLCSWVLEECVISLKSIDLSERRRALKVMNDMVLLGDISIAYAINCQGVINNLITEVADPHLNSLTAAKVLSGYHNSEEEKEEYYDSLLKAIRLWALCYPNALRDGSKVSNIKHIYEQLKHSLKIGFPEDPDIVTQEAIHNCNSKKKKRLNSIILSRLPKDDTYLVFPQLASEIGPPCEKSLFETFRQQIIAIRNILNSIYHQDNKIMGFIPILRDFETEFDLKIQNGHFNNHQLEYIVTEGAPLLERIQKIMPFLQQYELQAIGLKQLKNILLSKNKEITMSKTYDQPYVLQNEVPSRNSKADEPSSIKNSLERQLKTAKQSRFKPNPKLVRHTTAMEKPILKYTESYDFALNLIPTDKSKPVLSKNKKPRKPSLSEGGLTDVNYEDLLHSKPQDERNNDRFLRIVQPFESIPDSKGECAVTLGKIQGSFYSKQIYDKYNPMESKISENKNEEDRSDKIGSSNIGDQRQPSFGLIKYNQVKKDEVFEGGKENQIVKVQSIYTEPLPLHSNSNFLFKPYPTSNFSFEQPPSQSQALLQNGSNIQISLVESESMVESPDLCPQEFSYRQVRTAEDIIKTKPSSFLAFLQEDKDYLPMKRRSNSLKFLEQGAKELVRPSNHKRHHGSISHNLNSVFCKKLALHKNQDVKHCNENTSNDKKTALKNKIGKLQVNTNLLKLKLNMKEREPETERISREPTVSRVRRNQDLEEATAFKDNFLNSRRGRTSQKELKLSNFGDISCNEHQVWCSDYREYFSNLKLEEEKKNQLRSRSLLLKNEFMQIGCTSKTENHKYFVTFYITPNFDISQFSVNVNQEGSLNIVTQEPVFTSIKGGKQKRIRLEIKPLKVPYSIPTIELCFRISSTQYCHNYPIPCSFQKFVPLDPVGESELLEAFERKEEVFSTEDIKYSTKILRMFTDLSEYLPAGMFLRGGSPDFRGLVEFVGKGTISKSIFWLKVVLKPNQVIQISVSSGQMTESLKFLMATIGNIFSRR